MARLGGLIAAAAILSTSAAQSIGGCGGVDDPCEDCADLGRSPWLCEDEFGSYIATICGFNYTDALNACQDPPLEGFDVVPAPCAPPGGSADNTGPAPLDNCQSWDPASEKWWDDSVSPAQLVVDGDFVDGLVIDWGPIFECDTSRIVTGSSGELIVSGAYNDTLFDVLRLQNGDVLLEINGMPLADWDDAGAAFLELAEEHETVAEMEFTLVIQRGSNQYNRHYRLEY
jgi:hypothetical protein